MTASLRPIVEALYARHTLELTTCEPFGRLESGRMSRQEYDRFIANVITSHRHSPQLLAFLFALAAPRAAQRVKTNLLEELGIKDKAAHPDLLIRLADSAGLAPLLPELDGRSQAMMRVAVCQPLQLATLRDVGLAIMIEVFAFEYMLAKTANRIAEALARHRGLDAVALEWFTHHGVMDQRHAEEAFATIDDYVAYYEIPETPAVVIAEMTMRENVFIKRYCANLPTDNTKA